MTDDITYLQRIKFNDLLPCKINDLGRYFYSGSLFLRIPGRFFLHIQVVILMPQFVIFIALGHKFDAKGS